MPGVEPRDVRCRLHSSNVRILRIKANRALWRAGDQLPAPLAWASPGTSDVTPMGGSLNANGIRSLPSRHRRVLRPDPEMPIDRRWMAVRATPERMH